MRPAPQMLYQRRSCTEAPGPGTLLCQLGDAGASAAGGSISCICRSRPCQPGEPVGRAAASNGFRGISCRAGEGEAAGRRVSSARFVMPGVGDRDAPRRATGDGCRCRRPTEVTPLRRARPKGPEDGPPSPPLPSIAGPSTRSGDTDSAGRSEPAALPCWGPGWNPAPRPPAARPPRSTL